MEILHLTKARTLPVPPQEVAVDLTTGGNISHTSILENFNRNGQNFEFPHLRFHQSNIHRNLIEENDHKILHDQFTLMRNESKEKENHGESLIPERSYSPANQMKESKKRNIEDYTDFEIPPHKKQRLLSNEVSLIEIKPPPVSKSPSTIGSELEFSKECMPKYPHPNISGHPLQPISLIEHAAFLEQLKSFQSIDTSPTSIKETESLLAAVQHSQMLYYSYCTKLLQNLQTRRFLQEQEQIRATFGNGYHTDIISITPTEKKIVINSEKIGKETPTEENPTRVAKSPKQEGNLSPTSSCSSLFKSPSNSSLCSSSSSTSGGSPHSPSQPSSTTELDEGRTLSSPVDSTGTPGRKRAPRALTGKHVRPGTGASPSTLNTLRQKLIERQKLREEGRLEKCITNDVTNERSEKGRR